MSALEGTILELLYRNMKDEFGGGKKYHTIESGETLTSIAKDFGTTVDAIVALNGIKNPNIIIAGDSIRVR